MATTRLSLLCAVLLLLGAAPAGAGSLSLIPLDHWIYESLDRLSALGLLRSSGLISRPITRLEARRLVEEASAKARDVGPAVAGLAREDLRRLVGELSVDSPVTITLGGLATAGERARFSPDRLAGASSLTVQLVSGNTLSVYGRAVGGGEAADMPRSELYASLQTGTTMGQVGRMPIWWGPSPRTSLMLSDNAGTLLAMRLSGEATPFRLTKIVASLERPAGAQGANALLVGTRLDWQATPRFRIGLGETAVTSWGHSLAALHLLHPLPFFFSAMASAFLHDIVGAPHNAMAGIDFDWVVRPGVRLYGAAMIDDFPGWPAGTRWQGGLLAGLHLVDPFRNERTSLRIEYSLVTNRTYSYGLGLEHAYRGRGLGHWLGPDGDDLYLEVAHRVNPSATLRLSYAYTRRGEDLVGSTFLTGVVERRHTLGLQVRMIHSPSLQTRYRAEIASVANQGNVAGAQGMEGLLAFDVTYRWPTAQPAGQSTPGHRLPQPAPAPVDAAGRIALRRWTTAYVSQGPLSGPSGGTLLGIGYRASVCGLPLVLAYDADVNGRQAFWSADLHYPLIRFTHGTASLFGGIGGVHFSGTLGGLPKSVDVIDPRFGMEISYRLVLNDVPTPLYLRASVSTNQRGQMTPLSFWTYSLGAGWSLRNLGFEAGYRGAAGLWQDAVPQERTYLWWEGFYVSLTIGR